MNKETEFSGSTWKPSDSVNYASYASSQARTASGDYPSSWLGGLNFNIYPVTAWSCSLSQPVSHSSTSLRGIHLCASILPLLTGLASFEFTAYLCHVKLRLEYDQRELGSMSYRGILACKQALAAFLRWRAGGIVSMAMSMPKIKSKSSHPLRCADFCLGKSLNGTPGFLTRTPKITEW